MMSFQERHLINTDLFKKHKTMAKAKLNELENGPVSIDFDTEDGVILSDLNPDELFAVKLVTKQGDTVVYDLVFEDGGPLLRPRRPR